MIEWLAFPIAIAGAAFIPKGKTSDKKKIQTIFENCKIAVKKNDLLHYPKFIKDNPQMTYTSYYYTLPLGMPSGVIEVFIPAIKDGLNKEIEVEFDEGLLRIDVFETDLPEKWEYEESLLRPNTWEVPVGKNHKGILYHDFEKYCHLICGGVTRFGKTVFMKEVMNTLILNNPQDVEIYVLDLKGGLEFHKFKSFPQVKEVACDVFESTVLLNSLVEDLKKREVFFRENGYTNIIETPIKKRTFIFVDEGAELSPNMVKDKKAKKCAEFCQAALSEIARISGGLGYRLIFGTQYPVKEAVPMQVKMNIVARLAFICASGVASKVILDETGAEKLPSLPGRAIYLVEKKRTIQVPYIDDKMIFTMMEEKLHVSPNPKSSRNDVTDHQSSGNRKD